LLLLHIKGFPGREHAKVGELAERLQAQPHGVVALITRCEARGFVKRQPSEHDGREVEVHLTPSGERLLVKLAALHRSGTWGLRRSGTDMGIFPYYFDCAPDPDSRNLSPINILQNLDPRILDVSYRMLFHQNQGDPVARRNWRPAYVSPAAFA
jgi:DNA-binding MarR family transcriptional regulator